MSWRLAKSLVKLQSELDSNFPRRTKPDWTLGDQDHANRASDHNPHRGVVTAIDVRGREVARYLWDHLLETRDQRVKYTIFDSRIVSSTTSPWTPRRYSGSNPHSDHIHISVGRGPSGASSRADLYDNTKSWDIGGKDWWDTVNKPEARELIREVIQNQVPSIIRAELQRLANGPDGGDWNAGWINLKDIEKRIKDKIKEGT